MSPAQEIPVTPTRSPVPRNGRWSAFTHLVIVRMKELKRATKVVFWVFGFPLLLALGLGIAFRNKPADVTFVAIVQGSGAQDALSLIERSPQKSSIRSEVLDKQAALNGFRLGTYDLVVESHGNGGFQ